MKNTMKFLALCLAIVLASPSMASEIPLPYRNKFQDVPVMEIEDVPTKMNSAWIVDVRSKYEYETLHIKDAVNVPLGSKTFGSELAALLKKNNRPIVFYCNGGTCKKSYKAVQAARKAGINNCYAYDAGIYHWANRYPQHSVLLGKHPMQASQFIDNRLFKSRLIDAKAFETKRHSNAVVLDIRDYAQRDNPLFPFEEERAELKDLDKIQRLVRDARRSNKTLLVYDKVGKQIRWFQYFLEREGVRNYYFMKGGSEGYFQETLGHATFKAPGTS